MDVPGKTAADKTSGETAYWRELAIRRGRELGLLRERVLEFLVAQPGMSAVPFGSTLSAPGAWVYDVDRIPHSPELQPTDVLSALDDVWTRVATDR
jgi:hypothetical protein